MPRFQSRRNALLALLGGSSPAHANVCSHYNSSKPPGVEGFNCESRTVRERTHNLYWKRTGPAVFVLHELPGLYRADIDLARCIEKCGFSVYVPLFFGKPGECHPILNLLLKPLNPVSEFNFWLPGTPGAAHWLEPQLAYAHSKSGGRGVALIGMCLTGSLPLALISSPLVKAAVLYQPTNPFSFPWLPDLSSKDREALKMSTTEVLGFHFSEDRLSPEARWNTLRKLLNGRLTEMTINSRPGNQGGAEKGAHSTLAGDATGSAPEAAFQLTMRYIDNRISDYPKTKPYPDPKEPLPRGFLPAPNRERQ